MGRMKILLFAVSDEDRELLDRSLARLRHEFVAEADCAAAAALLGTADVNVVIADGRRPDLGWFELCRHLKADPRKPNVYFLLLAARGADEQLDDLAMKAGVDDFITKPGDTRELRRRLRVAGRMLEAVGRLRQLESVLSICNYCKRVRDELDHWEDVETYIGTRLGAQFNASVCPDCYLKNFGPEFRAVRVAGEP